MRIPDEITKSVGFVSRPTEPLQYGGTAFLVQVPYDEDSGCLHLVTAKHVAEAVGDGCVIAMNGKDGLPLFVNSQGAQWFYHPTEADSVDVAVLPFASTRTDEYDISPIPVQIFATDERIAEYSLGLGDEVFSVGLFTKYFGLSKLTPIVRTGNVAMMPKEKVPLKSFGLTEAYLIEGRSIGGLSGSPVFCRDTMKIPGVNQKGQVKHIAGLGQLHLLGLVHGHWDLPVNFSETEKLEAVNMGISIVIPAKKILEVLFSPALVEERERAFQRSQEQDSVYGPRAAKLALA
jgi:hypothetical protein